jgi:very-short-patch-repair endonuclease
MNRQAGCNNGFYGKKHTEETRELMSKHAPNREGKNNPMFGRKHKESTKLIIKEKRAHQQIVYTSKEERKIMTFLEQCGYKYEHHKYMALGKWSYQCDLYVPKLNLIIECDGAYWHNFPYLNKEDIIRRVKLIEQGFSVLELWDFSIYGLKLWHFKRMLKRYK